MIGKVIYLHSSTMYQIARGITPELTGAHSTPKVKSNAIERPIQ
jgi:hypothetical protein